MGYHVCSNTGTDKAFNENLEKMETYNIPFDSDCIDEQLVPTAFDIVSDPEAIDIEGSLSKLRDMSKKFVLHHPVQVDIESSAYESGQGLFIRNSTGDGDFVGVFHEVHLGDHPSEGLMCSKHISLPVGGHHNDAIHFFMGHSPDLTRISCLGGRCHSGLHAPGNLSLVERLTSAAGGHPWNQFQWHHLRPQQPPRYVLE